MYITHSNQPYILPLLNQNHSIIMTTTKYFLYCRHPIIIQSQKPLPIFRKDMELNKEQTPYPPGSQYDEEAIIQQVLVTIPKTQRLSLQIQNTRIYSQVNGLSPQHRKQIKNMKMGRSSQKCTVCMEGFKVDQIIKRLPCGHIFHNQCAKSWLKLNKRCPVCRLDLEQHFNTLQHISSQQEQISY